MKYEDFDKAKELVDRINASKDRLFEIDSNYNEVRIVNTERTRLTIGAYDSSEHELKNIAMNFIDEIRAFYQDKIKQLEEELSKL